MHTQHTQTLKDAVHQLNTQDFARRFFCKVGLKDAISCLSRQKILKICPVPNLIQCFSKEPFYLAFRPFKSVVIDNYQHILLHKIHTLFYQT